MNTHDKNRLDSIERDLARLESIGQGIAELQSRLAELEAKAIKMTKQKHEKPE